MSFFKMSGVVVPHMKNTCEMQAERMPAPKSVVIPMNMHIGAPAKPVVQEGDIVGVGQLIGEAGGFVSSPVYASVSGKVTKVDKITGTNGASADAVFIESDGQMRPFEGIKAPTVTNFEEFVAAVRDSGIVGLGGAGFPTAVKLGVKDLSLVREVLINGAECEPYITSDTRTMLDRADDIKEGIELLEKYLGAGTIIFGIEKNKPEAIAKMKEITSGDSAVSVKELPSIYPQGGEKVLIYNLTGKVVPEGKLPLDVGCIVINVTTLASIAKYIRTGMPLVEKCLTVDGSAVASPKNLIVPIGTSLRDVYEFAGGFKAEPKKVLLGGPMMGIAVKSLDQPVMKNTNATLALAEKEAERPEENPCIHCGRCVNSCPLGLNPVAFAKALSLNDCEALEELKINLCMECGCCAFNCPAKRDLIARHKLAKSELRSYQQQRAEQEKKEA
ncbi:MAG: electron transport complex subunit RsxC [Lachnospiraceae bacterium]|nr:electron transport complex subunit RsxC [Lachnospiraceae bacterium]